ARYPRSPGLTHAMRFHYDAFGARGSMIIGATSCTRIAFIMLTLALAYSRGDAQEKIKVSYSSIDAPNANWYIAEAKRLYQKYGLDTDLIFISSSTTNVSALVAGYVTIGNISGGVFANAAVGGGALDRFG